MNRRAFVRYSALAAGLTFGAGYGYARLVERHDVEVVPVRLEFGLTEPLTAVVLGDIHFDPLYEVDYLGHVLERVNRLQPELILYTGDFLSHSADRLEELVPVLCTARAPAGTFAVLGNHDHSVGADRVQEALEQAGIAVLRNRSVPLPGRPGWHLTGLESFWAGSPNATLVAGTHPGARHLLLVHEPDPFDRLTDPRIAVQVSGHTHGGQVRVPALGAVCLPSWGKRYPAGLYARGEQRLYVNRGIGTVGRHVRFNCRPEITVLTLA